MARHSARKRSKDYNDSNKLTTLFYVLKFKLGHNNYNMGLQLERMTGKPTGNSGGPLHNPS